ncbi:MAG: hypothetical protein ABIH83_03375 [Candidatus Micrarchaeota archaeon]
MASGGGTDYSHISQEIREIEIGVIELLDEIVESIERSHHPKDIEEKAKILAMEARRIAKDLKGADEFELNEHTVALENLERQAEELMEKIPDAMIFSEQKKWTNELEKISANLHKLKNGLSLLGMGHLGERQRRGAEMNMERMVNATKMMLMQAKDGVLHKKHAKKHETYLKLGKIRGAIGRVKGHIKATGKENMKERVRGHSEEAAYEMRKFISNSLEGRMHIDWYGIKMKSEVTGMEKEWAHNEINSQALEMVFAGTAVEKLVEKAKNREECIVANFACRQDAGGLLAEVEAIERKIVGDTIMGRPFKVKVMV